MGQYAFTALIAPTTAAASVVINTATMARPGCLSIIGDLAGSEVVSIQIPKNTDPDATTNAHWKNYTQADEVRNLRVGNDAEAIPVDLVIRLVKPVTASAVGVRWR